MRVTVTQDDIDHGKADACRKCPIARAMMRELGIKRQGPYRYVAVFGDAAESILGRGSPIISYRLPHSARWFQNRFDNDLRVEPFEFDAEIAE